MTETTIPDTIKVLFVDDEENVLRSLKRLFIDEDIEVYTASSGRAGLEMIAKEECWVVVSDQKMPEMNGSEFLERTREIAPDIMRIVLTGYADINTAINAINRGGAYRYITKPWNDADLVLAIRDAAEKYRLTRENRYLAELTKKQNDELKRWNSRLEVMVQEQTIDIQKNNEVLRKLNEQLQRNFNNSIEALSGLIEMRDKSASSHSKNVAVLAKQLAEAMSLSQQQTNNVLVAALLHDIGKLGVSDSILLKKENEMAPYEINEYKLHPIRGQAAVDAIEGFREIGFIIRHHHERIDGKGYVDGLKGEDIPIGSRIIAMADAVDRIVNDKASLAKNTYRKALDEIEKDLNKKFDSGIFPFLQQIILARIRSSEDHDYSNEVEVHPARLAPGMRLSRDIRSGTGLLILAQGAVLDQKIIIAVQRYYDIDPPATGVFIIRNYVVI